jgi:fermentation-respiration switch protein FrsA (DUF1100 family)
MNQSAETPRVGLLKKPWFRNLLYLTVGYGGLVLMLVSLENRLVYHPYRADASWIAKPIAEIEDVDLTSADGTRLHAWWCPDAKSEQAILYFHGNAGNLSWRGGSIVKLRNLLNLSVLIVDYPGYGKSEGSPSEQGCYLAADAAYDWLTAEKKIVPHKVSLYGASLGGGVAVDLASRKEHRALILVKTFTSLPDAASSLYWWLPVPKRALMTNRFDSLSKIGRCQRPVFIAHGTSDTLIPDSQGKALFKAANDPKRYVPMPGKDHNDELPPEFFTSLGEFLRETDGK